MPGDSLSFISSKHRRHLRQLEEEHCLAEARRLAQLAEQQVKEAALQEKEKELNSLSEEALSMKQTVEKVSTAGGLLQL